MSFVIYHTQQLFAYGTRFICNSEEEEGKKNNIRVNIYSIVTLLMKFDYESSDL